MPSLSEQDFRVQSDVALEAARRALLPLADSEGFEVELQNGVLNVVFEEPSDAKFVVSPNAPVRQIWVSAMARSYKLSWSAEANAFVLDGESLPQLLERLTRTFLESA
ncbi:MAG TPA: frataxin domain-containing protein [Vicinamibacterales bacterium]